MTRRMQIDELLAEPQCIFERQHNGSIVLEADGDLLADQVVEDFGRFGLDGVCHRQNSLNFVGASSVYLTVC